jgi:tRNAmet cytidine acetate ligase
MRTVGLITEYNPFHNGHLHHLRESLNVADAEIAVAVMSGHFLQRGEPALIDKWLRTEMALAAGVDVVIELPLPWACSSAPDFARGGVQALDALGGIDALCFGSEAGKIEPLRHCAEILFSQEQSVTEQTAALLRQGLNYPQSRTRVLAGLLPEELNTEALAAPNNILGLEYLKALRQTGNAIQSFTIRRVGAGYHDEAIGEGEIASATGIRSRLSAGEAVAQLLPPRSWTVLQAVLSDGRVYSPARFFRLLLGQILRDPAGLAECWLVDNGIENRLLAVAERAADLEELISGVKSRQLTRTRIQRMLAASLLGIKKAEAAALLEVGPRYLHLLGVSTSGERFLAYSRKRRRIPLVQNFSRISSSLKRFYGIESSNLRLAHMQLELELRASKIYSLLLGKWSENHRSRDFFEPLRRCLNSL